MKSAELKVLSAELKNLPQEARQLTDLIVLSCFYFKAQYSALSTQHSALS